MVSGTTSHMGTAAILALRRRKGRAAARSTARRSTADHNVVDGELVALAGRGRRQARVFAATGLVMGEGACGLTSGDASLFFAGNRACKGHEAVRSTASAIPQAVVAAVECSVQRHGRGRRRGCWGSAGRRRQ